MTFAWVFLAFCVGASSAFQLNAVAALNSRQNSTLSAYPSIVQVESYLPWGVWQQTCAASILNSRYVLSAAYCFSGPGYQPHLRRIRAGANYRETGGVIYYIERENNYPRVNGTQQAFSDVSVVRLANAILYTPVIRTTIIPQAGSLIPNGLSFVQVGWGRSNFSNALATIASVTVNTSVCGIVVGNQTLPQNGTGNILCANIPGGFLNSNADIGSPWLFGNITIGVVSGINYGINSTTAIVSASVASFTEWIVRTAV